MLFSVILLAIGVYVLVSGIRGKGKLFVVENLKEGYEEKFVKSMRCFLIPIGALMIVNGADSIGKSLLYDMVTNETTGEITYALKETVNLGSFQFLTVKFFDIVNYVCLGLVIAGVVGWLLITRKMTDRNAAPRTASSDPEAQKRAERQAGHTLPVSAFEFEEEEEEKSELKRTDD